MPQKKQEKQTKPETRNKKPKTQFIAAHGRRKEAVARIRLFKGRGQTLVNEKPLEEYFPGEITKIKWQRPFVLTKSADRYWATIKVEGSGKSGQLDAVVYGLSRALALANPDSRPILKKAGLLTRDPRVKERRKYGLAQKARKGKQSPKR